MSKFRRKILAFICALLTIVGGAVMVEARARLVVVAVCRDANAVEILDGDSLRSLARITVGEAPHEAIVSADGRTAYITNYGTKEKPGNSLSVIDLATLKETKRVDLGVLIRPHGLQEIGGKIYFTAEAASAVARFDPVAGKVDWRTKTNQMASHMLAASADGRMIYTANIASDSVTKIDAGNVAEAKVEQIAVGKQPEGIALAPDGKTLWIGHRMNGLISVIDTLSGKVVQTLTAGQMPLRLAYAPDGKRVYAINPQEAMVVVFDAATFKESGRITIDGAPVGLAVAPDGKKVFITDLKNGQVFALDAEKLSPINSLAVATLSDGIGVGFAASSAVAQTSDERAQAILTKARAAIGDEARLKLIESLSAEGSYRREADGRTADGGLTLYFNRADQYARSEFFAPPQGSKVFFDRVLDGAKGWLKPRVEGDKSINFAGFDDENTQAEERTRMRVDYPLQMLAILLAAPQNAPLEFVYAGNENAGGSQYEVVEVRGQNDFAARMFFDAVSQRFARLTYKGYLARPMGARRMNQQADGSYVPADSESAKLAESKDSVKKPQTEEITLTVAEYRPVDGLMLPHRITRSTANGSRETWEFKAYRLNAPKVAGLK